MCSGSLENVCFGGKLVRKEKQTKALKYVWPQLYETKNRDAIFIRLRLVVRKCLT